MRILKKKLPKIMSKRKPVIPPPGEPRKKVHPLPKRKPVISVSVIKTLM